MDKLPNDNRKTVLSSEFISKSDKDIATMAWLRPLVVKKEGLLVLSGGYAAEALCGGKITRPHGDIDARLIFATKIVPDDLINEIESVLKTEKTKWKTKFKSPAKADFIEDDDSKSFFNKRHLEVGAPLPGWFEADSEEATLIDSTGKSVKVEVISYEDLVASKLSKLYEVRNGVDTNKDRHTSATDYLDIKRLLTLPRYNKENIFAKLVARIHSEEKAHEILEYTKTLGIVLS